MGKSSHSAGDLAYAHDLGGTRHSLPVAAHLLIPDRQLQAKCRYLGVNSVRSTHHQGLAMLLCLPFHGFEKLVDRSKDPIIHISQLQRLGSIDHVCGGKSPMDVAGIGTDVLRNTGGKRDQVVMSDIFDFTDSG